MLEGDFDPPYKPKVVRLVDMKAGYVPRLKGLGDPQESIAVIDVPIWEQATQELPIPLPKMRIDGVADTTLANERKTYCADRAVGITFAEGKGAFILVADGIGMGHEFSIDAASQVALDCAAVFSTLKEVPTLQDGRRLLREGLMEAAKKIDDKRSAYFNNSQYRGDRETLDKIINMGTVVSIGVTCIGPQGDSFLLTANRGDCEINVIDVDKMELYARGGIRRNSSRAKSSVRSATSLEEDKGHVTRWVTPKWIDAMRGFTGEGFRQIRLPRHAIIFGTSDGWRKLIPRSEQEHVLAEYYLHSRKAQHPMEDFVDSFKNEALMAWGENDKFVPRDDISVAAMEVVTETLIPFFVSPRRSRVD